MPLFILFQKMRKNMIKYLKLILSNIMKYIISIIIGFILTSTSYTAQDSIISQMMETQQAVVEVKAENTDVFNTQQGGVALDPRTGRIVVRRKISQRSYARNGAGVIVHPDGIIVTNAHIGHKANTIKITLNTNEVLYAQPIRIVNDLDLLLLKIDADRPLPFVQIADSDKIALQNEVITIGNSVLLKNTISGGQIIGIGISRKLKHTGKQRTDLIQTTVNLYQGDSGGPLFNKQGQLIGLMTASEGSTDHSSFAIPSNKIKKYLLEYLNKNKQQ